MLAMPISPGAPPKALAAARRFRRGAATAHGVFPQLRSCRHISAGPRRIAALAVAAAATAGGKRIRGLQRRIEECSDGVPLLPKARPFCVKGAALGLVLPEAVEQLQRFPEVFQVSDDSVELIAGDSMESRSEAVEVVLKQLREEDVVPMLRGWREEAWPVKASFHSDPALVIERAAGPFFGVRGYGCHINGIVDDDKLWVAKRAQSKPTYPGCLDHLVAGGLSHGEKPKDNVIRECWEEAMVPGSVAQLAQSTSVVSYVQVDETGWGIKRDVLFCYDLQVPADFQPVAGDGEVESFQLMSIEEVIESLVSTSAKWKPNVALVIIDMLVRRGFLTPEEDGYVELVHALRG